MAEHLSSMDKALGYIPTPQMDELRDEWTDGWMDGQTDASPRLSTSPMPAGRSCMRLTWSCRGNENTLRSWSLLLTTIVSGVGVQQ